MDSLGQIVLGKVNTHAVSRSLMIPKKVMTVETPKKVITVAVLKRVLATTTIANIKFPKKIVRVKKRTILVL